jgi:alpha-D-xyloside xylohydrolase
MRTHPPLLLVTALVTVLALSSCGGDGGGTPAVDALPDAGQPADVAAPADTPAPVDGAPDTPAPPDAPPAETDEPTPGTLRFEDDSLHALVLTWDPAGGPPSVALRRGDEVLATSAADAPLLEVGVVPRFLGTFFYDPYIGPLTRQPAGLAWHPLEVSGTQGVERVGDAWVLPVAGGCVSGALRVEGEGTGTFLADLSLAGGPDCEPVFVRLNLAAPEGEQYYGLGEYFDQVTHRGTQRAMHIEVDGTQESGYNEAHFPIPLLVGTRGWGLFVEDRHPGAFDVAAAHADRIQVTFHQRAGLRFHLLAAGHPLDVPGLYTRLTGAPALPPLWAFAVLQWRDEAHNGAADVLDDAEQMRAVDYPAGAIWVDRPWETGHSSFEFIPEIYPDVPGMVARLHELGFRLAAWTVPYLNSEEPVAAEWAEAVANEYFVPLPDWWPTPFDARMIDLTNPDAKAFWMRLAQRAVDAGVEGWKLDYGEDIQVGIAGARIPVTLWNEESEQTMHHWYHMFYHAPYAEVLDGKGFLLSRAGTYGDQTLTTTVWPGDLCANFSFHKEADPDNPGAQPHVGGLPAAIIGGLSLSVSGYPWYASDTGGYRHSRPTTEVLVRWHQYSALLPIMQMGGGDNHRPWDFSDHGDGVVYDQETLDISRTYARLHLRLFPYFYALSLAAHEHGWPVVRPFGMAFPEDGRHPSWTFLVGDSLLVAPVYRGGQAERVVEVPAGRWVDWWDGAVYEGPADVTVPAPLDRLPLFVRAGGIVPLLRPTIDTLSPATDPAVDSYDGDPGRLWVRVVPDSVATSFDLHDGGRISATVAVTDDGEVVLAATAGDAFQGWLFEVDWHNRGAARNAAPTRVTIDGVAAGAGALDPQGGLDAGCGCWAFDAARGVVWVDVPAAAESEIRIR